MTPSTFTLPTFPFTPDGFLNPVVAALVGQILRLWLQHYLGDWRWRDAFLLLLCVAVQLTAGLAAGALATPAAWFSAIWLGFLGASVATFGQEAILNLLGLLEAGPRGTQALRARLGQDWRSWK